MAGERTNRAQCTTSEFKIGQDLNNCRRPTTEKEQNEDPQGGEAEEEVSNYLD